MTFLSEMNASSGHISSLPRDKGSEFAQRYNAASPFPHVVIDDFLPPALLEQCLALFPGLDAAVDQFDREQERFKAQFNPDELAPALRNMFYAFNSRPFIRVLENITGIKGLIPDPYFSGGGLHEIRQGGHLSVHADFNHHKPLNLERRINVLVYLNKDWREEYGGQLELWHEGMTSRAVSLLPSFNRCVIFNTTSESYHGNPQPINHPDRVPRRSIALYYYTATWDGSRRAHTTQFVARPGSADRPDWQVRVRELSEDLMPPIIMRSIKRVKRRVTGSQDTH